MRKLLLGDRQFWNSNLRVTLLIRAPDTRERKVVLKTIYRMSEAQFRQYWISTVFRAEAGGPKIRLGGIRRTHAGAARFENSQDRR